MKNSLRLFLASLFFISTHCFGQGNRLSSKILQQLDISERKMVNALSKGDSTEFKKIAGYDYLDINANGTKATLQQMLNELPDFRGLSVSFSEQSQRIYGNFVLRNGKAELSAGGKLVAEVFYTQGWVYRNNKWQFVHWQGTLTKEFLQRNNLNN